MTIKTTKASAAGIPAFDNDTLAMLRSDLPAHDGTHVAVGQKRKKDGQGMALLHRQMDKPIDRYDRSGCARCRRKPQAPAPWHMVKSAVGPRVVCPACLKANDRVQVEGASVVLDYGQSYDRLHCHANPGLAHYMRPAFHLEVRALNARASYATTRLFGPDVTNSPHPDANAIFVLTSGTDRRLRLPFYFDGHALTEADIDELRDTALELAARMIASGGAAKFEASTAEQAAVSMAPFLDTLTAAAGMATRSADVALSAFEADQLDSKRKH